MVPCAVCSACEAGRAGYTGFSCRSGGKTATPSRGGDCRPAQAGDTAVVTVGSHPQDASGQRWPPRGEEGLVQRRDQAEGEDCGPYGSGHRGHRIDLRLRPGVERLPCKGLITPAGLDAPWTAPAGPAPRPAAAESISERSWLRSGEADAEPFDPAGPAFALGFGNPIEQTAAYLHQPAALDRIRPTAGRSPRHPTAQPDPRLPSAGQETPPSQQVHSIRPDRPTPCGTPSGTCTDSRNRF